MVIPFIDLKRYETGFMERWLEKVSAMSARSEFVGGPEVASLERGLIQRLGVEHAITCANGTDALQLALRAMGVGRGDIVIVPDVTFWATFEAVVNVGAQPVTIDVDSLDGGVDFSALEQAIAKYAPKAAIVAHLYGWGSGNLTSIRELCRAKNVMLLEDGAQCFGVDFDGTSIYSGAYVSTTSFYPAKVLGAAGDGGAVFTNDAAIAEKVRQLSNHGRTMHYGFGSVGWNSRMDALQAAFLNLSLDYIDARISSRRSSADYYRAHLVDLPLQVMNPPKGYSENGYCNVCHLESELRTKLESTLKAEKVAFGNIYPGSMSTQSGAGEYLAGGVGGKNAEKFCNTVLNLPLFPYMTSEELERVVKVVKQALI